MNTPPPPPPRPSPGDISRFEAIADIVSTIMAMAVGGSAAVVAALGQFVLAGVLALIGKNKVAQAKGPQATVQQGQASVDAVKLAVERGQAQGEAEAEARKAARKNAPSITSGQSAPTTPSGF